MNDEEEDDTSSESEDDDSNLNKAIQFTNRYLKLEPAMKRREV